MLKLQNIKKSFDGKEVLKDISIEVGDGEIVSILGPSGCGKSTTLRMIAGLEEISDGELYIVNKLMNDVAPKERDIAMVFQNYALFPHMTVRQNIEAGLEASGKSKQEKKGIL